MADLDFARKVHAYRIPMRLRCALAFGMLSGRAAVPFDA